VERRIEHDHHHRQQQDAEQRQEGRYRDAHGYPWNAA
jgi:hypothetical protein